MRQRTLAFVVLASVGLSSLITWFASSRIQSPAEAAARTAPPVPTAILVAVEERRLASKIVSRGTAHYGSPRTVSVTSSKLKAGPRVVTSLPATGAVIKQGDAVLTISGRPVFLFDGAQPTYRDLGPGLSGTDVRQLERALERAGFSPGRDDGMYDDATGRAVADLYREHGFEPITATRAQIAALHPVQADLVDGGPASGGVQLPADEVVFLPGLPLRVTKVAARLGAAPGRDLVTVTNSVVSVDGALPVDQAGLVKPGTEVLIDEPALGIKAKGRVGRVADQPGTDGADGFHVFFEVVVDRPPPALVGASVRLTVPVKTTRTAQLTVPVSAVSLGPDGGSRVERSVDGKTEYIAVEPGLSADGYVAITDPKGLLRAGDEVTVGFQTDGLP